MTQQHHTSITTLAGLTALVLLCAAMNIAQAQQATERYIPIGQSPGVSGKTAMMGTVVGYEGDMLIITSPAYPSPQRVRMVPSSRIWLDRSAAKQPNMPGSVADLRPGRRVEIRFADAARRDSVDWIKVEAGP